MPRRTLAQRVLQWQRVHGRHDLPWQNSQDPYRVWLSEVMLQQTQVATVLDYYARFLQRFPDVAALAAAPLDEVLALWSGLGYYSRARNLHRAAQVVMAEHGGQFPRTSAALQSLPGVGRSTAAAIAAFCFGERVAILDGNVKRVLSRALGFDGDLARAPEVERLWTLAQDLVPAAGVESYTQGLMDLGATVCATRDPACSRCPLAGLCVAQQQARPQDYPVKTRKTRRSTQANAWLWLAWRGQVWLVQRPPRGIWAGLWSLPEFDDVPQALAALDALPGQARTLPSFVHVLTHRDWTLTPLQWALPDRLPPSAQQLITAQWPQGRWVALDEALALGIPAPLRKLLQHPL
jgi:A/G-specific adenine glycosylase